jgi:hypothetical protein
MLNPALPKTALRSRRLLVYENVLPMSALYVRYLVLTAVLLTAFGLRLHGLTAPELNIDETWSYVNSYYLAHPSGYTLTQILSPEPNNALHLLLTSVHQTLFDGRFAVRWLSVLAGVLTVALASRAAFRLYGRRAALMTALLVGLAYAPVTFSQIARPYALATLFATLSLVFWLEKRPRLNMLAGVLVALTHVAAMPIVFVQDILTLVQVVRGRRVNRLDWIIRRVPVYGALVLLIYMQYLRRDIHVISRGQTLPAASDFLYHALNVLHNGFPGWSVGTVLFMAGVAVPLLLIAVRQRRRLHGLALPLLWVAVSYAMLWAGARFSDGMFKWLHLSAVAIPLALLSAAVLAQASRLTLACVLTAFTLASVVGLADYYQHPYRYPSDMVDAIARYRDGDETVYIRQPTLLWTLQLNRPDAVYIQQYPIDGVGAADFLFAEINTWANAAPPPVCGEPLWREPAGVSLHRCH